jgi:hypothetical protein
MYFLRPILLLTIYVLLTLPIDSFSYEGRINRPSKKDTYDVHVLACPFTGVEAGCLMVKDPKDGKIYNITAAPAQPTQPGGTAEKPKPNYLVISLYGTVCQDCGSGCGQGTILKDIKWSYTKQRCKKAAKKKVK